MDYTNNKTKRQYELKLLEGVLWLEERQFRTRDGRDFIVCKGKLKDSQGIEYYIDAYKNFTKNGKPYFSLKLKTVSEINMMREKQQNDYIKNKRDDYFYQNNEMNINNMSF
jgi:hypothetical protein